MNQPLAYVHPGAKIAKNVVIEPFTTIHNNVEIGEGTWIGSNVTIMEGARIGKNCNIFPGAVISAVPQDLKFGGEIGNISIGKYVTIGAHSTILPNVIIPDGFACGAYSLLKNINYLEYSLWAGIPAKFIKLRDGKEHFLFKMKKYSN